MTTVAFIGLGNMGRPMATNLVRAGHDVRGFDVSPAALEAFGAAGGTPAATLQEALAGASVVISILRNAHEVTELYCGEAGVLKLADSGALLIDCSTIGPKAARTVISAAGAAGFQMLDAPVSGGQPWAEEAKLTFIVGGDRTAVERAEPLLRNMGQRVLHAGIAGNGQVAKVCNNLIACVSTTVVAEAFVLGKKLGLDHQTLFDIVSTSSGQCWGLTTYCPVPGPVPTSPASRGYAPGFATNLMLKDMVLAVTAAREVDASLPLGDEVVEIYKKVVECGYGDRDWTIVAQALESGLYLQKEPSLN
ncbi:3-hydroxyisobutyrate dehydrogenase [Ottowia thiooxydans]|uniref:3-hydroxyisobutyrate dehydrogenase n=1 Tax=Ottowia thiooxydans TaxID=219182 RepID=A0ABV2QAM4_9BURK